jgi:hypothetical protein
MPFKFPGDESIKDIPVNIRRTYDHQTRLYTVERPVLESFSHRYSREVNKVQMKWASDALGNRARLEEEGKI